MTTSVRTGRRRAVARVAVAAAVLAPAAATTGCTFTNPQMTTESYVPGKAAGATLGTTVVVSSLLLVASGPGAPAALVARITNSADQDREITLTAEGLEETFTVPDRETLALGGVDPGSVPVIVDPVPAAPGLNTPMTLTLGDGTTTQVQVPVLSSEWPEYQPYLDVIEAAAGTGS